MFSCYSALAQGPNTHFSKRAVVKLWPWPYGQGQGVESCVLIGPKQLKGAVVLVVSSAFNFWGFGLPETAVNHVCACWLWATDISADWWCWLFRRLLNHLLCILSQPVRNSELCTVCYRVESAWSAGSWAPLEWSETWNCLSLLQEEKKCVPDLRLILESKGMEACIPERSRIFQLIWAAVWNLFGKCLVVLRTVHIILMALLLNCVCP